MSSCPVEPRWWVGYTRACVGHSVMFTHGLNHPTTQVSEQTPLLKPRVTIYHMILHLCVTISRISVPFHWSTYLSIMPFFKISNIRLNKLNKFTSFILLFQSHFCYFGIFILPIESENQQVLQNIHWNFDLMGLYLLVNLGILSSLQYWFFSLICLLLCVIVYFTKISLYFFVRYSIHYLIIF